MKIKTHILTGLTIIFAFSMITALNIRKTTISAEEVTTDEIENITDVPETTPENATTSEPEMVTKEVESTSLEEQTTEAQENGWVKSRYYIKGKYLTGFRKINNRYYFFGKTGKIKVGFQTIKKKKYYFNKKGKAGIKGSALIGRNKIKKKWYFFDKKGVLKKKTTKEKGITYYISDKGILEVYRKKNYYYRANGKKMKSYEVNDYLTFLRARKIVGKITSSKMTKAQKIKACFEWVRKKPYIIYRKFSRKKDWPAIYANDHFLRKGGDCHADGSAMAYLARALGYKKVYVCLDCDGIVAQGHCWAEINGRVYDPLFIEKGDSYKYYNGSYKHYELSPILHLKIAYGY